MKKIVIRILSAIFQTSDTLLCKCHLKRPKVVMNIVGGICSQMLQYLQGQYYEDVADVYYDISWYEKNGKDQFGVMPRSFELLEMWPDIPFRTTTERQRKWYYLFFQTKKTKADWLPNPSSISCSIYLSDDWDLPAEASKRLYARYFDMRKAAKLTIGWDEDVTGIHVRRGDLAKGDNPFYGGVSDGYFLRAIDFCNEKFSPKKYLFFSDEPNWVEQNICPHVAQPYEIIRGNKAWEDLWLLAHCSIIVASQGSFGRVAAMLNPDASLIQCDNEHAKRDRENTYFIE